MFTFTEEELKKYIRANVNREIKDIITVHYLGYNVEIRYGTKKDIRDIALNGNDIENYIKEEL